ncbi:methyl-accepting chemotaxis protein [Altererythrobacter salegens]|uniref:Methyl-accepting chemotaxis protein n=1 Tax=Croceibacterium salegens TaxID=1737568 RepID=A0A6I4SUT2_9SPHN|nr:methyl-accepting chemotaxis protein [Croceibacterium salegens]MXO59671.1 methyl-accepting chemotaxis protein [Croceibacterium salegens]
MKLSALLADLGEQAGDMSVRCSETGGIVGRLNRQISAESERLGEVVEAMAQLNAARAESSQATSELLQTAKLAEELVRRGNAVTGQSLDALSGLIADVTGVDGKLHFFLDTLGTIGDISRTLRGIAEQSELLSFNASIEAARGGEATRPFTVLASEIRNLASSTSQSAREVGDRIVRLEASAADLIETLQSNIASGRKTAGHIDALRGSLVEMAALVEQFRDRSNALAGCHERAGVEVAKLDHGITEFGEVAVESARRAAEAVSQLDELESRANDMLNRVSQEGVATRNTPFVEMALQGAAEVAMLVEIALAEGKLSHAALFDTDYRPRKGTDPVQYDSEFADFADAHIRPVLDRWTRQSKPVAGCCLVDLNGYLPTHISERSQPQVAGQRRRNLEVSRNRQIFMDSQTRRALDGDDPLFVFAYRQDLGEGRYRALRSVFVPLHFAGRKWGLYEVGYLI